MKALSLLVALLSLCGSVAGRSKEKGDLLTPYEAEALQVPYCCPKSPSQYCDFGFDGYMHTVPVFHLTDGYNGDKILTPSLSSSFHWDGSLENFSPGILYGATGQLVDVFATNKNGTFLRCPRLFPSSYNAGKQFYVSSGNGKVARLWTRAFQKSTRHQHGMSFYKNRCVYLPLTGVTVTNKEGKSVNLLAGDGNMEFPEKRRCVIFKTS